jgi:hypothetical protein
MQTTSLAIFVGVGNFQLELDEFGFNLATCRGLLLSFSLVESLNHWMNFTSGVGNNP